MREIRPSGSVEGVIGNRDSYSDLHVTRAAPSAPPTLSPRSSRLRRRRDSGSEWVETIAGSMSAAWREPGAWAFLVQRWDQFCHRCPLSWLHSTTRRSEAMENQDGETTAAPANDVADDEQPVVTIPAGHPERAYVRRGGLILPLRFARRMAGWQDDRAEARAIRTAARSAGRAAKSRLRSPPRRRRPPAPARTRGSPTRWSARCRPRAFRSRDGFQRE